MSTENMPAAALALKEAVCASDARRVEELLTQHSELRAAIDRPLPDYGFGIHACYAAVQRSDKQMVETLLRMGANVNQRTEWWAGGFGVLDECSADFAPFLMERGAVLDAHSAARLGMMPELQALVKRNPEVVHARGGDGQRPLHFAANVSVAEFLLANGAEVNARDVDHESTAAQYMLQVTQQRHYAKDRRDVARFLVAQGSETDILLGAALGDEAVVARHLKADPDCIRMSVSDKWFPKREWRAGGTIYRWTLGDNWTAHMAARNFGHQDIFSLLMKHTPTELKLSLACELGDEEAFEQLLQAQPDLISSLSEEDHRKLPNAAKANNREAVRLMLKAGWPVNTRGEMGATALHWAGFNGNAAVTQEILRYHPRLDIKSREYDSTALEWAQFGSGNSIHGPQADFAVTIQALKEAADRKE